MRTYLSIVVMTSILVCSVADARHHQNASRTGIFDMTDDEYFFFISQIIEMNMDVDTAPIFNGRRYEHRFSPIAYSPIFGEFLSELYRGSKKSPSMEGYILASVTFSGIDFDGLSVDRAYMNRTHFRNCQFSDTDFTKASTLLGAVFEGCTFEDGVTFNEQVVKEAVFLNCDGAPQLDLGIHLEIQELEDLAEGEDKILMKAEIKASVLSPYIAIEEIAFKIRGGSVELEDLRIFLGGNIVYGYGTVLEPAEKEKNISFTPGSVVQRNTSYSLDITGDITTGESSSFVQVSIEHIVWSDKGVRHKQDFLSNQTLLSN